MPPRIFDEPCRWRVEAASALRLTDDELVAVLSPGAAFPAVLESMVRAFPARAAVLVDIGAGGGGASEWLRVATGAAVIAVEPEAGARRTARECFPRLAVVDGSAADTGLPDHAADIITLCGVWSLLDEVGPVLDEIGRLIAPGGIVAVTDLFAHRHRLVSAPNVFRTLEETVTLLTDRGWEVSELGCGTPAVSSPWAPTAELVDSWIEQHCSGREGYGEWLADRDHLGAHIDHGDVLAGSVVATVAVG